MATLSLTLSPAHRNPVPASVVRWCTAFLLPIFLLAHRCPAQAPPFAAQINLAAAPATQLVKSDDLWRYRKGTNAPPSGWKTALDSSLDATWLQGRGGIGYGDADDFTVLTDMRLNYSTIYLRRTFTVPPGVNSNRRAYLIMDYDDGFIAWIDGMEIGRSRNVPSDAEPSYTNTCNNVAHEASRGLNGNPPETFPVPAGVSLAPGTHVLAIMGFNDDIGSSDLSLIPDLFLEGESPIIPLSGLVNVVQTNSVLVTGSNSLPAAVRFTVNAEEATLVPGTTTWSFQAGLLPGVNPLFIAAHDVSGQIITSLTHLVVYENNTVTAPPALSADTTWALTDGIRHLSGEVLVPAGITLTINPGAVLLLSSNASIRLAPGATLRATGCFFLPESGASTWGALSATGRNARMELRAVQSAGGTLLATDQASLEIEDSYLRHRDVILASTNAADVLLTRVQLSEYRDASVMAPDKFIARQCFFAPYAASGTMALRVHDVRQIHTIENCSFQGDGSSEAGGLEFGSASPGLLDSLLIRDFQGAGISLQAPGGIVSRTLVHHVATGIVVNAASQGALSQTTVADATLGVSITQGGELTNTYNNILARLGSPFAVPETNSLTLHHSLVQGANWPGEANLNDDPLFVYRDGNDYALATNSPARGSGINGLDMGTAWPIGGPPAAPQNLAAHAAVGQPVKLSWIDVAGNEQVWEIERSTNKTSWTLLGTTAPNETLFFDSNGVAGVRYYYRVRATNLIGGFSAWSNPAGAQTILPAHHAGGTLASNTLWTPEMGIVYVHSNVVIPSGLSLTIVAGTHVQLTNSAAIIAQQGGSIRVEGSASNEVVIRRWNGTNNWGELRAEGEGASISVRHADISGGQTAVFNGASAHLEETYFHDFFQQGTPTTFNQPIVISQFAATTMVRRCYFRNYYETLWRNGVIILDDCLFEDMVGDAMDYDGVHPGSVIRRCTFRHGNRGNVDAIDIGNDGANLSRGVVVDSCLMYDFPFDKGISIGEAAQDVTVTNCLIFNCLWGIGVKDSSSAEFFGNTVALCDTGFRIYEKIAGQGSGFVTNSANNILGWNTNSIGVFNSGLLNASFTDTQGTNWLGSGNIDADPSFVDALRFDFRLQTNSPCRAAGSAGQDLGASLPVGSSLAPSNPALVLQSLPGAVGLEFQADHLRSYTLESAVVIDGPWLSFTNITGLTLPQRVHVERANGHVTEFYRLNVSPLR